MKKIQYLFILIQFLFLFTACNNEIDDLFTKVRKLEIRKDYETAFSVLENYSDNNNLNKSEILRIEMKKAIYDIELKKEQDAIKKLFRCNELAIEVKDQKRMWESSFLLLKIFEENSNELNDQENITFVHNLYTQILDLEDLEQIHVSAGLKVSKIYEMTSDYLRAANTLFKIYHSLNKELPKINEVKIQVLSNLSQIYALSNQYKDAIEVEKIIIKELQLLDSSLYIKKNDQILLSLYNIVRYKDYKVAGEFLYELEDYFIDSNDYDLGRFYMIYGDLKNLLFENDTHNVYLKSKENLLKSGIIDENIFNSLIKDSLFLFRLGRFSDIIENSMLFDELYKKIENNQFGIMKKEMDDLAEKAIKSKSK